MQCLGCQTQTPARIIPRVPHASFQVTVELENHLLKYLQGVEIWCRSSEALWRGGGAGSRTVAAGRKRGFDVRQMIVNITRDDDDDVGDASINNYPAHQRRRAAWIRGVCACPPRHIALSVDEHSMSQGGIALRWSASL